MSRQHSTIDYHHGMEPIYDELVRFDNVKACYNIEATHTTLTYTQDASAETNPHDWIGLFPLKWKTTSQPLASVLAGPRTKSKKKKKRSKTEDKRQIDFPLNEAKKLDDTTQQYQFVYVAKHGVVYGTSKPFTIQGEELWNLEGDEDDFSRLSSLQSSPVSVQHDSEISIISRGHLGSSESPVILSYPSDGEVEWELPNVSDAVRLEKEESPLSEFSDIEILSTSPSKDDAGKYTNVVTLIEDDFTLNDVTIQQESNHELQEISTTITKSATQNNTKTDTDHFQEAKVSKKQQKKNKKKKAAENSTNLNILIAELERPIIEKEEMEREIEKFRQNMITEALVEKLKFVDTGDSNSEDNLSEDDERKQEEQSMSTTSKKGKKKKRKEKAKQLLIKEISPAISSTSIDSVGDQVSAARQTPWQTDSDVERSSKKKNKRKQSNEMDSVDVSTEKVQKVKKNDKKSSRNITLGLSDNMFVVTSNAVAIDKEKEDEAEKQKVKDSVISSSSITSPQTKPHNIANDQEKKKEKRKNKVKKVIEEENVISNAESETITPPKTNETADVTIITTENSQKKKQKADKQVTKEVEPTKQTKEGSMKAAKSNAVLIEKSNTKDVETGETKAASSSEESTENPLKKSKSSKKKKNADEGKSSGRATVVLVGNDGDSGLPEEDKIVKDSDTKQRDTQANEAPSKSVIKLSDINITFKNSSLQNDKKTKKEKTWKSFMTLQNEIKETNADDQKIKLQQQTLKESTAPLIAKTDTKLKQSSGDKKKKDDKPPSKNLSQTIFSGAGPSTIITKEPTEEASTSLSCSQQQPETVADVPKPKKSKQQKKLEKLEKLKSKLMDAYLPKPADLDFKMSDLISSVDTFKNNTGSLKVKNSEDSSSSIKKTADQSENCKGIKIKKKEKVKDQIVFTSIVDENEIELRENRSKYMSKAKQLKKERMKADLKNLARKSQRKNPMSKVVDEIKDDEEEDAEMVEENSIRETLGTSASIQEETKGTNPTPSPPNDAVNFPPLKNQSESSTTVFTFTGTGKSKTKGDNKTSSLKAVPESNKFSDSKRNKTSDLLLGTSKLSKISKSKDLAKPNLEHASTKGDNKKNNIITQLCNNKGSNSFVKGKVLPKGNGNGGSTTSSAHNNLCRSQLLDVIDAVPKDPSAFNFHQWRKMQAFGKTIPKNQVDNLKDDKDKTFVVGDKVAMLKQATKRTHSGSGTLSVSDVTSSGGERKKNKKGATETESVTTGSSTASYATVLKQKRSNDDDDMAFEKRVENEVVPEKTADASNTSCFVFNAGSLNKAQNIEAKLFTKARRSIFSDCDKLNLGQAALEAQCYMLDKADDKIGKSACRKMKLTRGVKLFKEKHKKARQLRIKSRRLKELKNASVLSYSIVPKPAVTAVCNKALPVVQPFVNNAVISWPIPKQVPEISNCFLAAAKPNKTTSTKVSCFSGQTSQGERSVALGNRGSSNLCKFGTSVDSAMSSFKNGGSFVEEKEAEWRWKWYEPPTAHPVESEENVSMLHQLEQCAIDLTQKYHGGQRFEDHETDDLDMASTSTMVKKKVQTQTKGNLPKSLRLSHCEIEKLRLKVSAKDEEVNSLQNEINDMKELIKKQSQQALKARLKMSTIKRKYTSAKALRMLKSSPKRSRVDRLGLGAYAFLSEDGEDEEDDAHQADPGRVKEPPCKRMRLEVDSPRLQEAKYGTGQRSMPDVIPKRREETEREMFSLYPDIQEELRHLQREVSKSYVDAAKKEPNSTFFFTMNEHKEGKEKTKIVTSKQQPNEPSCGSSHTIPQTKYWDDPLYFNRAERTANDQQEQDKEKEQQYSHSHAQTDEAASLSERQSLYRSFCRNSVAMGRNPNVATIPRQPNCYSPPRPALLPTPPLCMPRSPSIEPPTPTIPVIPQAIPHLHHHQMHLNNGEAAAIPSLPRPQCPPYFRSMSSPPWDNSPFYHHQQQDPDYHPNPLTTLPPPQQPSTLRQYPPAATSIPPTGAARPVSRVQPHQLVDATGPYQIIHESGIPYQSRFDNHHHHHHLVDPESIAPHPRFHRHHQIVRENLNHCGYSPRQQATTTANRVVWPLHEHQPMNVPLPYSHPSYSETFFYNNQSCPCQLSSHHRPY